MDNRDITILNVAAHGYFTLKFKDVWRTVKENIPELKKQIENLNN